MKKHCVEFKVTAWGCILIDGDSNKKDAVEYVKRHISFNCDTEGNEGEIDDFEIDIISCAVEREPEAQK